MERKILLVENKYERGNHYVGISLWHFEFVTKYRYKMFQKEEQKNLVGACIRRAASINKIKIVDLNG